MRSDSTLRDLHYSLQIMMGWSDLHLNQFVIRGKRYGVSKPGGIYFLTNADEVSLYSFHFRPKERFLYEYDFNDNWQHEIRYEKSIDPDPKLEYPYCTGGGRSGPPEDCGGPWEYLALRQQYSTQSIIFRFFEILEQKNSEEGFYEEIDRLRFWLKAEKFNRKEVNRRLKLYISGDESFLDQEGGWI